MEKLLVKHGTEMNIKVEDAIARAQTPAPMLNPDEENLRQQVCPSYPVYRSITIICHFLSPANFDHRLIFIGYFQ